MKKLNEKIFRALYFVYLAALLTITVIRPWNGAYHFLAGRINARIMAEYAPILKYDPSLFIYLFFGNIAWFVPFGFYHAYFRNRSFLRTALLGLLLSLFIEVMQFVLGRGVSEVDDLILNTCGSIAGWCLAKLLPPHRNKKRRNNS